MIKFSIHQLKFADEMAFPADMEKLLANEPIHIMYKIMSSFYQFENSLIRTIFNFSRADYERCNGELSDVLNRIIQGLIGDYDPFGEREDHLQ